MSLRVGALVSELMPKAQPTAPGEALPLKPGMSDNEVFCMKTHTTIGRDAIASAEARLGITAEFLTCAKEIAYGHQEKWDGSGYPDGLGGDDIPISARLMLPPTARAHCTRKSQAR